MTPRIHPVLALLAFAGAAQGERLTAQQPAAASSAEAISVLERAEARYAQSSAFCADFQQEMSVPLLKQNRTSRGRMCQKRPNLFAMRFSDPQGDAVVADGTFLWIYYPSVDRKQVLRSPLVEGAGTLDFHREFLSDPGTKYTATMQGRETVDGRSVHKIALTPRQRAPYQSATVWVDAESSLVRRVEIREENGSVRRVSLTGIDLAAAPAADVFRFTPPPGSQVISR